MKRRMVRREVRSSPEQAFPGLHPVLARVYAARNVGGLGEVDYSFARLCPVTRLSGIAPAVELLVDALARQQHILVIGDFDADGATSCAVALRALRQMGARHVDFLIPNRFQCGYGLTPEVAEAAASRGADLVVTVDNGISSVEGVARAKRLGLRVLITDHHLPGRELPDAHAIVNPNLPGDGFPSKHLAGVGVIFYLLIALRAQLREIGWFVERGIAEPNLGQLLDVVALGTVADVVPLDHNNRILVAQGLERIRRGNGQPGVRALLQVAGRAAQQVTTADLAFGVAPRLNAAGRLKDMTLGVECLLADQEWRALEMARELDELNRERRRIESGMQAEALAKLERLEIGDGADLPVGLCLFDEDWHQGVIGILAARIKDRFHRPVIAFAEQGPDELKGSARSVPGLHIRDVIDAVAARQPGLVSKFGGHAMAAGLSLRRRHLEPFATAFDAEVRQRLPEKGLEQVVYTDGPVSAEDLGLELAELLQRAGPWGAGFPEPVFDGKFRIVTHRIVGERHLRLGLEVPGSTRRIEAIAFDAEVGWRAVPQYVNLAYRLAVNNYQGVKSAQLIVEHVEPWH